MDISKIQFLSLNELEKRLREICNSIIFLSKRRAETWGLAKAAEQCASVWIDIIKPLPCPESVWEAFETIKNSPETVQLIAIGGGSAIDLAKTINALRGMDLRSPSDVLEAIKNKTYLGNTKNTLPLIAVPSTSGTGSEVTQWATVWNENKKYSVDAPHLKPNEVWIVPELTHSLPPKITLATGLDAVCHAAEAYWAKTSNPLAKELSIRSLQLITSNLRPAIDNPGNHVFRYNMSVGALLAGLSFSQTRTTACHSISYPLTAKYQIEHGFACALTLSAVAETNGMVVDLSSLFDVFYPYGGIKKWINEMSKGIIDLSLSGLDIPQEDIKFIAQNSFSIGRMDNNPVDLTVDDVVSLLMF